MLTPEKVTTPPSKQFQRCDKRKVCGNAYASSMMEGCVAAWKERFGVKVSTAQASLVYQLHMASSDAAASNTAHVPAHAAAAAAAAAPLEQRGNARVKLT